MLIKSGADVNIPTTSGLNLLHVAAKTNNYELANLLIECGAEINVYDQRKIITIYLESLFNNIDVVSLLIDNGVDPDISNEYGTAPLQLALKKKINIKWPVTSSNPKLL